MRSSYLAPNGSDSRPFFSIRAFRFAEKRKNTVFEKIAFEFPWKLIPRRFVHINARFADVEIGFFFSKHAFDFQKRRMFALRRLRAFEARKNGFRI